MNGFSDIFGSRSAGRTSTDLVDEEFQKRWPTLHMLLTVTQESEKVRRQVCTMTIVVEDGVVKAGLRERNHGLSLWITAGSILGVFTALEEALQARPVDWRKVEWNGKQRKT